MPHAPGPWKLEELGNLVRGPDGYTVAQSYTTLDDDGSLMRGNGHLIAAAPDGHEILLAIHEFFRHWNPVDPSTMFNDTDTFKQAVEAYIAKAKGNS